MQNFPINLSGVFFNECTWVRCFWSHKSMRSTPFENPLTHLNLPSDGYIRTRSQCYACLLARFTSVPRHAKHMSPTANTAAASTKGARCPCFAYMRANTTGASIFVRVVIELIAAAVSPLPSPRRIAMSVSTAAM